jgi:hypothetical protein
VGLHRLLAIIGLEPLVELGFALLVMELALSLTISLKPEAWEHFRTKALGRVSKGISSK